MKTLKKGLSTKAYLQTLNQNHDSDLGNLEFNNKQKFIYARAEYRDNLSTQKSDAQNYIVMNDTQGVDKKTGQAIHKLDLVKNPMLSVVPPVKTQMVESHFVTDKTMQLLQSVADEKAVVYANADEKSRILGFKAPVDDNGQINFKSAQASPDLKLPYQAGHTKLVPLTKHGLEQVSQADAVLDTSTREFLSNRRMTRIEKTQNQEL